MSTGNRHTQKTRLRVLRLYAQGYCAREVAERTGVCDNTVQRYARQAGIKRTKSEAEQLRRMKERGEDWKRAARLVSQGLTYQEAARIMGCSATVVMNGVRRLGRPVDNQESRRRRCWSHETASGRRRVRLVTEMARMRIEKQASYREIGEAFGYSARHVAVLLRSPLNPYAA